MDAGATVIVVAKTPITMSVVAFHVSMAADARITLLELRVAESVATYERLPGNLNLRLANYGVPPNVVIGSGTFELKPELGIRKDELLRVKARNDGDKRVNFAGAWLVERPGQGHNIQRATLRCTLCNQHVTEPTMRDTCKPPLN